MNRGLFVTGTDTGVGKTRVAAGILRWLRRHGVDAVPMKPVQTGAERRGARLVAPDVEFSLSAAGISLTDEELRLASPYVYEPACSPHLAGRMAQSYPEMTVIKGCADRLLQTHQAVVAEGAGGIMVPLNERDTMLDLMKMLEYPVVIVSRVGLGAINHALLSIQVLRTAGIDLVGIVFNQAEPPLPENRFIEQDNPPAIARFGDVKILGNVPYSGPSLREDEAWRRFEECIPGLETIREVLKV